MVQYQNKQNIVYATHIYLRNSIEILMIKFYLCYNTSKLSKKKKEESLDYLYLSITTEREKNVWRNKRYVCVSLYYFLQIKYYCSPISALTLLIITHSDYYLHFLFIFLSFINAVNENRWNSSLSLYIVISCIDTIGISI